MGVFRKKPVVVEAVQWDGEVMVGGCPDWLAAVGEDLADAPASVEPGRITFCGDRVFVGTEEGTICASPGDFIIKGTAGELYPCKPTIFVAIYDAVDEAAHQALAALQPPADEQEAPGIGRVELSGGQEDQSAQGRDQTA